MQRSRKGSVLSHFRQQSRNHDAKCDISPPPAPTPRTFVALPIASSLRSAGTQSQLTPARTKQPGWYVDLGFLGERTVPSAT